METEYEKVETTAIPQQQPFPTFPSPRSLKMLKRLDKSVERLTHAVSDSSLTADDEEKMCSMVCEFNDDVEKAVSSHRTTPTPEQQRREILPLLQRMDNPEETTKKCLTRSASLVTSRRRLESVREGVELNNPHQESLLETRASYDGPASEKPGRWWMTLQTKLFCCFQSGLPYKWREVASRAFVECDLNQDGFLTREELVMAFRMMQKTDREFAARFPKNVKKGVDRLFSRTDLNHDNLIDKAEFLSTVAQVLRANSVSMWDQVSSEVWVLIADEIESSNSNIVGRDLWLIHPMGVFYILWDLVVSIGSFFLVFTLPLTLGWGYFNTFFYGLSIMLELIFMVDLVLNFFTGYIDESGMAILDVTKVRRAYLCGYFVPDFLSSIPFDIIFKLANVVSINTPLLVGKHVLKSFKILRVWKLIYQRRRTRLFKVARRVFRNAEHRLNIAVPVIVVKICWLLFWTFVLSHWMGCFQFLLVRLNGYPEDSWVVFAGLKNEQPEVVWSWSVFKALSQLLLIGFDTPPLVNVSCQVLTEWCQKEHWVTLFCLYIGAVYYSFLVSSMLSVIQARGYASMAYHQRLSELEDWMQTIKLPEDLQESIRNHFHTNHPARTYYNESELMKALTPYHVKQVKSHRAKAIIEAIPLLSAKENEEFAKSLGHVLHRMAFAADEVIFRKGAPGDSMFFVLRGTINLRDLERVNDGSEEYQQESSSAGDLGYQRAAIAGSFFGEVSIFIPNVERTMDAICATDCVVFRVSRGDLLSTLEEFPETEARFKKIAHNRYLRWLNRGRSRTDDDNFCRDAEDALSKFKPEKICRGESDLETSDKASEDGEESSCPCSATELIQSSESEIGARETGSS